MSEDKLQKALIAIAGMKSDMRSLKESFDEFKDETKEYHKNQAQRLDDMAESWQEIGSFVTMVTNQNKQIEELEKKVASNTKWRWILKGGMIVLSALVGLGILKINNLF